jgi:3-dehydroquinate dehydratase-2
MTRVLVLNGPNLNLLGSREPEIYGHTTLTEIEEGLRRRGTELGLEIDCFQSNHEGALIDRLQERDFDWAIVNAGGLTHTSISLRDALKGIGQPFVEVHISDPGEREEFRKVNYLQDIATERIVGKGAAGYTMALDLIAGRTGEGQAE